MIAQFFAEAGDGETGAEENQSRLLMPRAEKELSLSSSARKKVANSSCFVEKQIDLRALDKEMPEETGGESPELMPHTSRYEVDGAFRTLDDKALGKATAEGTSDGRQPPVTEKPALRPVQMKTSAQPKSASNGPNTKHIKQTRKKQSPARVKVTASPKGPAT